MNYDNRPSGETIWRNSGKWALAFVLFLAFTAFLLALQLFQASAEGTAVRTHVRAIAALTEIDTLIERNYDDLQARADASQPGDLLQLRDYPIDVPIPRDEALGMPKDQLREVLLNRSATVMYEEGTSALHSDGASDGIGRFTAAGAVDRGLDVLRDDVHSVAGVLVFVLAVICGLLAVTLAALSRGFGRLGSVGAVIFCASLPLLLLAIAARINMGIENDGETGYVQGALLDIGTGLVWIPIRNGIAFTALGAIFVIVAMIFGRWPVASRGTARDAA